MVLGLVNFFRGIGRLITKILNCNIINVKVLQYKVVYKGNLEELGTYRRTLNFKQEPVRGRNS